MMGLGSKMKKNIYVGIGVQYPVIQDSLLITRNTVFKKCVFKDRRNLFLTLIDAVDAVSQNLQDM